MFLRHCWHRSGSPEFFQVGENGASPNKSSMGGAAGGACIDGWSTTGAFAPFAVRFRESDSSGRLTLALASASSKSSADSRRRAMSGSADAKASLMTLAPPFGNSGLTSSTTWSDALSVMSRSMRISLSFCCRLATQSPWATINKKMLPATMIRSLISKTHPAMPFPPGAESSDSQCRRHLHPPRLVVKHLLPAW